jgi:hypothetical protein
MAYPTPVNYFRNLNYNQDTQSTPRGVQCKCNQPAVAKAGGPTSKNPGKQFWCCQLGERNGGCKFFQWLTPMELKYQQPPPQLPPRPSYDQPIVDVPQYVQPPQTPPQYQQQPSPPQQQQIKKRKIQDESDEEPDSNIMDSFKLSLQLLRDRIEILEHKTNDINHIKCDIRMILDKVNHIGNHLNVKPTYNSDDETDNEQKK